MARTTIPIELSSTPSIVDGGNATAITIDASENVGIGTSSITNNTLGKTTYFGNSTSSITGHSSSASFWLGNNWYYNSGDKFIGTGYANLYTQQSGEHQFLTSTASGTAGAAATFTQVLKINSSGNVGIGTSPDFRLHVSSTGVVLGLNATSGAVSQRFNENGTARFFLSTLNGSNGLAFVNGDGTSERMRIDSSGNVGIRCTPTWGIETGNFRGSASAPVFSGTSGDGFAFDYYNGANPYPRHGSIAVIGAGTATADMSFWTDSGSAVAEAMRIDSSGNLLVGTTSLSAADTDAKLQVNSEIISVGSLAGLFWTNRDGTVTGGTNWAGWYSTSANHFLYSENANIASIGRTSGTYTALSDVNKKKDFEDSTVGLAEVMQLQPKKFRMLKDADDAPKSLGFIAQDVEHIIPEAYVESTSVDAGGTESTFIGLTDRPFIAALTKAIQEQQALIESLTARITTLEG